MQRHRNPANGFRSNPIGIGGGGGVAGGPGYRSYNRGGFGRGQGPGPGPVQPKVFQSGPTQPPPPRRIDVFLEAGKLASEYLASKGLLPPNSSNGKWQNSNLKNPIGGGVSDAVSDTGGVRRRFPDEIRTRRTMGSFKNPAFEWNREINRSSSWSEKVKEQRSSDKQGDSDSVSESMEEQRPGKDGEQKSVSGDLESKSYEPENVKPVIENKPNEVPDDNVGIKTPNSDVSHQDHVEYVDKNDSLKNPNNTSEVMTDEGNQEAEKPIVKEEPTHENSGDENNKSSSGSDLLTLIRFNKVPTRTRSSVTLKGSKSDSHLTSINENHNKTQNSLQDVSMGDAQSEENQGSSHEIKTEDIPSEEKVGHGLCTRSQSFPQRSSVTEQDLGEGHHGYSRSSSEVLGRGEKRPLHLNESPEPAKKPREWVSVNPEGRSGISQPSNVYAEEKQLFPSSFKICDLNLMEVSDVNENHDSNSVIGFRQAKQEPVSVDFDLSMNSSCDVSDRHTRRGSDGKAIEVIDLDCDSVQDDKVFNSSERRDEAIFTDLESFPDSMQRVSDMPQDGYGLMISELLEADIPNSTVPTGVSSMHNEMSLQNEEGILGDDESIYMSLGEIPISFVPVWDQQPSQGYDKHY